MHLPVTTIDLLTKRFDQHKIIQLVLHQGTIIIHPLILSQFVSDGVPKDTLMPNAEI